MNPLVAALCWSLIYVARALEFVRLWWGTLVLETWFGRFTWRPMQGRPNVHVFTWFGNALLAPFRPTHWLAVEMTSLANRGLPPLGEDEGFLARLYPKR